MSQAGFYELLTGHFANGQALENVSETQHLAHSIADHIARLLNSRQGALHATPGYGLPDSNLIYANQPAAREQLRAEIAQAILRYEPRVQSVQVKARVSQSADFLHTYQITCQLKRSLASIELEGWLRDDGQLHLQPRGADANTSGPAGA